MYVIDINLINFEFTNSEFDCLQCLTLNLLNLNTVHKNIFLFSSRVRFDILKSLLEVNRILSLLSDEKMFKWSSAHV